MEYFIMRQDPKLLNVVKLLKWATPTKEKNRFQKLRMSKQETRLMFVTDDIYNEYPDFIEEPFYLISDKLKRIMKLYQPNLYFETVVLSEPKNNEQNIYHFFAVPEMECASSKCVRRYGKIEKLILDPIKIGNNRIFKVLGEENLIVRLDVAESILRRVPYGILFERVEIE